MSFSQSYDRDYCTYNPQWDATTEQELEEYDNEMCYQADADRDDRD